MYSDEAFYLFALLDSVPSSDENFVFHIGGGRFEGK